MTHQPRYRYWPVVACGPVWGGPVFDNVNPKVVGGGGIPGPSATITHHDNSSPTPVGPVFVTLSNILPDMPIDQSPAITQFNSALGALTTAVGGIGHLTNTADSGYGVVSFPGGMGVTQTGGSFSGPSSVEIDFTQTGMRWDVAPGTQWDPPLFVYQLFAFASNFAAADDVTTFEASFDYKVDVNGDGVAEDTALILFPLTTITPPNPAGGFPQSVTTIKFAFALLRSTAIPEGAVYQLFGHVEFTAEDPDSAGIESLQFIPSDALPRDILDRMDDIGLPQELRSFNSGVAFAGVPEPGSLAAWLALSMVRVLRLRRT